MHYTLPVPVLEIAFGDNPRGFGLCPAIGGVAFMLTAKRRRARSC